MYIYVLGHICYYQIFQYNIMFIWKYVKVKMANAYQ